MLNTAHFCREDRCRGLKKSSFWLFGSLVTHEGLDFKMGIMSSHQKKEKHELKHEGAALQLA